MHGPGAHGASNPQNPAYAASTAATATGGVQPRPHPREGGLGGGRQPPLEVLRHFYTTTAQPACCAALRCASVALHEANAARCSSETAVSSSLPAVRLLRCAIHGAAAAWAPPGHHGGLDGGPGRKEGAQRRRPASVCSRRQGHQGAIKAKRLPRSGRAGGEDASCLPAGPPLCLQQ